MGAGLINTKAAIETDVYATVEGSPWVALKEINAPRTFTVTLTNKGDKERVYNTGATCVVNETNTAFEATTTVCSNVETITASAPTVTVPAQGTATVSYTVTPDISSTHWLSAWAKLTPAADANTVPELVIPVLGFVGDWNAEKIFDAQAGEPAVFDALFPDPAQNTTRTALVTPTGPNTSVTSVLNKPFWVSPNGDGVRDSVHPLVVSLRNAWEVRGKVLNANGEVVREVGKDNEIRRNTLNDLLAGRAQLGEELNALRFDGHLYNKKTGNFEPLPEGDYTYRLQAKLADGFAAQDYDFAFKVDTTKPTLTVNTPAPNAQQDLVIPVTAADALSGLNNVSATIKGEGVKLAVAKTADGNYEITLPADYVEYTEIVEVVATDNAGNTQVEDLVVNRSPFTLDDAENWAKLSIAADTKSEFYGDLVVKNAQRKLSGSVIEGVEKLYLNNVLVPLNGRAFDTTLPVNDGAETEVILRAESGGKTIETDLTFLYDSVAPEITLNGLEHDAAFGFYYAERKADGTVRLEGSVADANSTITKVDATLLGKVGKLTHDFTGNNFAWDLPVPEHFGVVKLTVTDGVNESSAYVRITNAGFNASGKIVYGDLSVTGFNLADRKDENVSFKDGQYYYSWDGILASLPSRFLIDDKEVPFDPKTGAFNVELPLTQGITPVNLKIYDLKGDLVFDTSFRIFFDSIIPVYTLEEGKPAINADGAIYLKEAGDVQFKGTVSDNAFGYALALNGNILEYIVSRFDPSPEANQRDFDTTVAAEDGDIFFLGLYDQTGNFTERKIPIVVDKLAPEMTTSGIEANATYQVPTASDKVTKQVTVETTDANLASLRVLVDGEVVSTKVVKAVPHPKSSFVQEGDSTEGKDAGSGNTPEDPKFQGSEETAEEASANTPAAEKTTGTENGTAVPAAVAEAVAKRDAQNNATGKDATPGAETAETTLAVTVEVEAAPGDHVLAAEATDKGGNLAITNVPFVVEVAPAPPAQDEALNAEAKTSKVTLTATGKAPKGVTFSLTAAEEGNVATFTAKSQPVAFQATYSLAPATAVAKVELVGANGELTVVKPVLQDGKLVFQAYSDAVIRVTYKAAQIEGKPIAPPIKKPAKPGIPNTGTNAATLGLASALFLVAGAAFVVARKRKTA
ncbi:Fn3-like domain-containing protein [Gleimia sp. 6138-11-ORH1]|nr:Fn3-like domain-containing protein [Gleimia sp. 6138-11-ORH1]